QPAEPRRAADRGPAPSPNLAREPFAGGFQPRVNAGQRPGPARTPSRPERQVTAPSLTPHRATARERAMPEDNLNEGSLDLVEDNQATQEDAQAATQPDGQVTEPAQEPDQTEPTAQHQAEAQTQTDPDKRDPTKKIEQINYEVRNLSRRLDALLQRIEEQGRPATPQQQAQVEQLQDELSRIENDELADEKDKALIRYLRQQQQQADE